ncbi:MAG: EamA family transporter [Nitrospinota bacterium]
MEYLPLPLPPLPALLALFSAVSLGVGLIFIRLGLREGTPLVASITTNATLTLVGALLALATGAFARTPPETIFWFILVGLCNPSFGRFLEILGYRLVGLARSNALAASAPIMSVGFAAAFLGERPGGWVVAGAVAIAAGVALVSWPAAPERGRDWRPLFLLVPLAGAVGYSIAPVFAKTGMTLGGPVPVAMLITFGTGTVMVSLFSPFFRPEDRFRASRKSLLLYMTGGLVNSAGSYALWSAIHLGEVSVAIPLSRTSPLFVLLFSQLFLGRLERVSALLAAGAALIVLGGALIAGMR